jgi:hypothetical protein
MKPVDELKPQRHQERDTQEDIGKYRGVVNSRKVCGQTVTGIDYADDKHRHESKDADFSGTFAELGFERGHGNGPGTNGGRSCGSGRHRNLLVLDP